MNRSRVKRIVSVAAVVLGATVSLAAPGEAQQRTGPVPVIRFHVESGELLGLVYPSRYTTGTDALAEDRAWVREASEDLVEWWDRQGSPFLQRVADLSGLDWPYRDIDVYLVRFFPTISIQHPLVLALDTVRSQSGELEVPDDDDLLVVLLAHQITHYALDDPDFLPDDEIDPIYDHAFLAPGNFSVEAMVNWVTYTALEELWGRERLAEATSTDLWETYNPNHGFVVDELRPRWRLSRLNTLREFLQENPPDSEIFRVREAYVRESRTGATGPEPDVENLSGADYGFDIGASFDGDVFVSYVDGDSPADRSGLRRGDVIATIEGRAVGDDVAEAKRRIESSWENNEEVNLSVLREGEEVFVTIGRR